MGLIKAVHGALGSVLEEQWKEIFWCDAMNDGTLLIRGTKRVGKNSANTRMDDNVLTNGSLLCVADGQCVLVVKQGKVIDFCREPGEHVFEDPEQAGLKGFFQEVGRRVAFGGGDIQPVVHRVYYLNVREIPGNPFLTPAPIPFRVKDPVSGLDLDSSVLLGGLYSYRVSDPVLLYRTIVGNVEGRFTREEIRGHLDAELMTCLQPALAALSQAGLRPEDLPSHVPELCEALRDKMNEGWCGEHGLELGELAIDTLRVRDSELVQSVQHTAMLKDPAAAAAFLTQATASAMSAAAASGGSRAVPVAAVSGSAKPKEPWKCVCGAVSEGAFCPDCGRPRPAEWVCVCGRKNKGRFCQDCGRKKPE